MLERSPPKGRPSFLPEEKLLRAIFGEKAGDVRDTSLKVPHGIEGIVIDAKVFSRKGQEKDERTKAIEDQEKARLLKNQADEIRIIMNSARRKIGKYLIGKRTANKIADEKKGRVFVDAKEKIKEEHLLAIPFDRLKEINVMEGKRILPDVHRILTHAELQVNVVKGIFEDKLAKLKRGDELAPGVIKTVKVYVAMKRKLSVGDKISGRHGNKGIISRILPAEDMPYLEDGTPVEMVVNPLGVPSRMNVGQILETHLGMGRQGDWAEEIEEYLEKHYNPRLLRRKIREIYSSKEVNEYLDQATDEDILTWSEVGGGDLCLRARIRWCFRRRDQGPPQQSRASHLLGRRPSTTEGPGSPSTSRSPSAICTCSSCITWWMTRSMRAPSGPILW